MAKTQDFSHHEGAKGEFEARGLRSYFEYQDLGIAKATHGEVVAHVIRAREGHNATGQWHRHECTFQMYYVLSGTAKFEYEGQGVRDIKAGDCVLQPPGIRHREIEHSADFSLIEIVAPADFATSEAEAPGEAGQAAE